LSKDFTTTNARASGHVFESFFSRDNGHYQQVFSVGDSRLLKFGVGDVKVGSSHI
jgi:hypothetical protein